MDKHTIFLPHCPLPPDIITFSCAFPSTEGTERSNGANHWYNYKTQIFFTLTGQKELMVNQKYTLRRFLNKKLQEKKTTLNNFIVSLLFLSINPLFGHKFKIQSFQHFIIQSFYYYIILLFHNFTIPTFDHSIIQLIYYSTIPSFNHSIIPSFQHSINLSFHKYSILSFHYAIIPSFD